MRRLRGELMRYVFVGALSTFVHFTTLLVGLKLFEITPVGLANFAAALAGSSCAFLGNRYVVFRGSTGSVGSQLTRFAGLYLLAATFHGSFLYVWSDVYGWHYAIGFVIATAIQIVGVYVCNRTVVFK